MGGYIVNGSITVLCRDKNGSMDVRVKWKVKLSLCCNVVL